MADSDEKNVAIPPVEDDDDEDLDDITDVWDEEKLKAALGELRKDEASGPATQAQREQEASVEVSDNLGAQAGGRGSDSKTPVGRAAPSAGLSWPLTIALAVTLGVAAYLLITYLK